MERFTGVKVFSTTLARDRDQLSDRITGWLRDHPEIEVVDKVVTQSSDKEFHCLSLTFFFRERKP
jgi:folate-dependent tRNA-U54 methylase TrmFO/GidA